MSALFEWSSFPPQVRHRLTERGVSTRRGQHTYYVVHHAVCSLSSVNLSRASPHLEAPALLHDFTQISFNTFKSKQTKMQTRKVKSEKNQINPPSTAGRARKKGPSFSSDPVSTRRTEIERRGGERNGHISLSPSLPPPVVLESWFLEQRRWMGWVVVPCLPVLQPRKIK